ncbi:MAG: hypothetical protein JWO68_496 [Actinomycetia bacterium]|nr:hypothetical protein [Actinomycetes bacterium]
MVVEHVRLNLLTADPARLADAIDYIDNEARPLIEKEVGSLGMAIAADHELGLALISSYWVSGDAMRESAGATAPMREEAAHRARGTMTVELFQVATNRRLVRPRAGAGVRITRFDFDPTRIDDAVANYEDTALPWLTGVEGFCSAHLFVHHRTGHAVEETVWQDAECLAASRSGAAAIRVDTVAATDAAVRALAELELVAAPGQPV